ncbi:hypothetical protein [Rugamonas rubra]|uniref:Uncharacterized protein n=1 Tax=Rugamonas rubra TaxID=758825 RepID=A0A1I4TA46_9BURK|nr:hypothetical protein [Rugamonas rubra]SFM73556.1 hypothetical protein SAMN02982985_05122 [Rugamonas rubra]
MQCLQFRFCQIAGFISPFLVGSIKDKNGSTDLALYILSAVLFLGAVLVMRMPDKIGDRQHAAGVRQPSNLGSPPPKT